MGRVKLNPDLIHRISHAFVFVISLPLLLLGLIYAGETIFWTEGPATDYPLFHTPRPDFAIRIHGLLCLISASALVFACARGMMNHKATHTGRSKQGFAVFFSCLVCIWWNPWSTGTMQHEELIARTLISTPFIWMMLLHAASSKMAKAHSTDSNNNSFS